MKNTAWLVLSLLMVAALVLASCTSATPAEKTAATTVRGTTTTTTTTTTAPTTTTTTTPTGTTTTTAGPSGPVMVTDVKGRLVEKPQYGGTITLYTTSDPSCWDPWENLTCGGGSLALGSVYEVLLGGDWSVDRNEHPYSAVYVPPGVVRGYTAESWTSPDPLTYIINIRQGMRMQNLPPVNGREVTSDDIKYSIDRQMGLGDFAEVGGSPNVGLSAWEVVDSVEIVDKYTLILHISEPAPLFTEYWGPEIQPWLFPRELVDTYGGNWLAEETVGWGPWQIDDYVIESSFTFLKHPNYYGWDDNFPENQIPYADKMKVLLIEDGSTQLAALRTGKIDVRRVDWEDAEQLKSTNPELLWKDMPNTCRVIDINVTMEPYSDIRVRKAMQMAINLEELAEEYYGGLADPFPSMVHPSFPIYYTPFEEYPADVQEAFTYNPEGARALLAEAGYPNGFKQVMPLSGAWDLADLFNAYWEDIGIETEIRIMEGAAYNSFIYSGNQEMTWIWSCGYWMPTQVLGYWYGGQDETPWNFSDASDPTHDANWNAIMGEADVDERTRLIKEAFYYGTAQYFYTAGPIQPGYNTWQPWLKGYQGEDRLIAVAFGPTWARVWVDQDLKFELTGRRD